MSGASLHIATFHMGDLSEANFEGAVMAETILADVDLTRARGLEAITHQGRSALTIGTVYRSGRLPETLLRGVGAPDDFIAFARDLRSNPIQYCSCFLSHSSKDKRFCKRLYDDLQGRGVRVWYFPENARWGASVWGEIDRSIMSYDRLVVVCPRTRFKAGQSSGKSSVR